MTIESLTRRIDVSIAGIKRRRGEQDATRIAIEWIRAGLMSKLALLPDQGVCSDLAQRCAVVDQDQARRKTPAIRAALACYCSLYPATDERERIITRLSGASNE